MALKPFATKNSLAISVYWSFPVDYTISVYMMTTLHSYILPLHCDTIIFDKLSKKRCSESNILTIDHKLFLENSNSAAVNTILNTVIYLKAVKYLNIRLRQIY